jgi:hypothetical protein
MQAQNSRGAPSIATFALTVWTLSWVAMISFDGLAVIRYQIGRLFDYWMSTAVVTLK